MVLRLFNAGLRLGALGMKLILMLYMGKYLGLSDLGTYGLVAAYVAIAIPLLGFRVDYVASRDVVDLPDFKLAAKMRDQIVLYAFTYLVLVFVSLVVFVLFPDLFGFKILLVTIGLAILESIATITSGNLVSLKQPILANALFFVRSAAWIIPAVLLGFFFPIFRSAETIFSFWFVGVSLSLAVTAWVWRRLPWKEVLNTPVDWEWIKVSTKKCIPIWVGAVSLAGAGNVDRFVVEMNLGRSFVGISSFYGSFVVAISALLSSGVFAFAYPQLISAHRINDNDLFDKLSKKMGIQATISATFISIAIGIVIPYLGKFIGKEEFFEYRDVLWAILFGSWLRCATEHTYYMMYARHQDRQVWIGNFIFLVAASLFNAVMVPIYGFMGIGYGAILSAIVLCLWRVYCIRWPSYK